MSCTAIYHASRDQIWRLRFQHEALDWIDQDEPILPTRKRTSSTEGSSQLSIRGTVTAAEPMRKRRMLDTHTTGNHIVESTPPPKSMDTPGKFYESTGDARTLAKPTSPDGCQNKTMKESDPVPCGNAAIRQGRSSSIDKLAFSDCENQALKPNNVTHRSKQTGRPPNTRNVPYMLCIPSTTSTAIYKSLNTLPAGVAVLLKSPIHNFCVSTSERAQRYARYLDSDITPSSNSEMDCLLNYSIRRSTSVPAFTHDANRACNTCSRSKDHVCVRRRRIEGLDKRCLLFFAKEWREGVAWNKLGF
jgi:hypothetical protein